MRERSDNLLKHWSKKTPAPIQNIPSNPGQPQLSILRLDLLQSWTSGNKYFKLKYLLHFAIAKGIQKIVSKGGMFSNHLSALADACTVFGIQMVGVIRSYTPDESNPCIQYLRAKGVDILYLSPDEYKKYDETTSAKSFPTALFIPEGGLSEEGIRGTSEIMQELNGENPSHIILAGGTLGTACGILDTAPSVVKVVVVPAWKGCTESYLIALLQKFSIQPLCSWEIWPDYHFGGFGKFNTHLIEFMTSFKAKYGIPLDPVYTGKLMYAIDDKIQSGYFKQTDSIMAIHTGGFQGLQGFKYRFPDQWGQNID